MAVRECERHTADHEGPVDGRTSPTRAVGATAVGATTHHHRGAGGPPPLLRGSVRQPRRPCSGKRRKPAERTNRTDVVVDRTSRVVRQRVRQRVARGERARHCAGSGARSRTTSSAAALVFGVEMSVSANPYWTQREVPAMGSTATVMVGGGDTSAVEWALDELAFLERTWSRFRPDSDLCQMNARAGEWTAVTPTLLLALDRARTVWESTAGRFNPAVLPALEAAGYDTTFDLVRCSDGPPPESGRVADFGDVEIDLGAGAVRLPSDVRIDLGGIGKGLAADLVAEGLVDRGADSALVCVGGDIRAAGQAPSRPWAVPVEDPCCDGRTVFTHALDTGAIVTSTTRMRTWTRGAERLHHLIDPRTGLPADSGVCAVVVAGAEAWLSEGLAKAALIAGVDQGGALLRGANVQGWFFLEDGSMRATAP